MKLTVLTENTTCRDDLQAVHGLSLLLETNDLCMLSDVGPGEEFAENARTLGIDLNRVSLCVISHGHYDHGGGLTRFLRENGHAPVYVTESSFQRHFSGKKDIGLMPELKSHPQVRLTGALCELNPFMTLFSQVPGETLLPAANAGLTEDGSPDRFLHEQDLLIWEDDRLFLFGGCAHRGIVNILKQAKTVAGRYPDVVVSGLHLAAGGTGACMADDTYLDSLAEMLLNTGAVFYTGHCTGPDAFQKLKLRMGDRLMPISTGMILDL